MSRVEFRSGVRAQSLKDPSSNRKSRRSFFRLNRHYLFALAAATATPFVYAQTIWTGTDSNLWNDANNWNPTAVPGSGVVAEFGGTSNNNSNVSLNSGTQAIGSILFDNTPTSFNLGVSAGDTFIFDAGGAITMNSDVNNGQTIGAAIQTTGAMAINDVSTAGLTFSSNITVNGGGTLTINAGTQTTSTTTFNGQILNGSGGNASVAYLATNSASSNNNFVLNAANTYSGPTTINVWTGNTGSFQIGSSSPFGTGTVTINSPNGSQFSAINGSQTISNAFLMNGGMQYVGNNSMAFNGPLQFLFNANNGLPTLSDKTIGGAIISFGTVGGTSTITLGNPVSGGTSVSLVNVNSGSEIIINDQIVDPSATGHGNIEFGGQAGGIVQINGLSTYAGQTIMNGNSTVQYSISSGPTSGPFGIGTINFNNTNNNQMQPIGGGTVTLSNPIQLTFGFTFSNAPGDTTSALLTGPISLTTAGRTLTDNMTSGASLTLGAATNPSTLTLSTAANANTAFTGTGAFTVNDVIQNNGAVANSISYAGSGVFTLNGQNTFSLGASLTTNSSIQPTINIGASSTMSGPTIVSGPFGTGPLTFNTGANSPAILVPTGTDRTVANPVTIKSGFWASNSGVAYNLSFSGPVTVSASKTITNNMSGGVALNFGTAAGASTLTLNGNNLSIQSQNGTAAGGVTVINDIIQDGSGSGSITAQVGGTLYLNGQNTFSGGVFINNSTVVVSSDANLGAASGEVLLAGASSMSTLLANGTFTTARTIDLGAGTNVIDATAGNTLTLTGPLTDVGDLTKGTSTGTVQLAQSGGLSFDNNINVNGGLMSFGTNSTYTNTPNGPVVNGGGLNGPVNIGGALTVNSGKAAFNPSLPGTGQTNSVGSLSIGNGGSLDIGNHTVIVQNAPDETVIGKYLSAGYSGGFWNGTSPSGGAIQSIVAFNDNSGATSIGYGNSNDFTFGGSTSPYRAGGPKALSGNQVVVAPALEGDLLLEGSVGPDDLAFLLNAFGTTGNDWAFGNIDYDAAGLVGPNDLSLLLSNFGHSSSGFAGAKTSAKSLTSTAKPSLTASGAAVQPPPADGIELVINYGNNDVEIFGNNATLVTSVVLTSPGNQLIGGTTFTPAFHMLFDTSASNTNGLIDEFNTFANGSTVDGTVDMGQAYNFATPQGSGDVQFQFSEKGVNRGGLQTGSVTYILVPEPTTLSLLAVASAGLLGRRRKRNKHAAQIAAGS